ncbi:hypothetical protein M9H77_09220 [Catharanthus roseus]|uniref:Uncharacterized protein n=1 Tax=Catharanthus roseus TaxID=4058 RepID=A0ACC0C055_CATRO|nr:hypothetical protein M9H77_09220 [Catharanthus roseus]
MDPFEDYLQGNVGFEDSEDPNKFEECLELEEYIDHGHLFTTDRIFNSKDELVDWVKQTAMKANIYLIVNRYQKSRTSERRLYVTLACEGGGTVAKKTKPIVNDEEEQTEQFRKSHVPLRNILRFFREQNVGCADRYIKKNMMKGRNTIEEESNVLSDIVVAHPTSIAMIRTWPYVLIMNTTYKTNKYNMPLMEAVGMTPTGKNFTVATSFMCNE